MKIGIYTDVHCSYTSSILPLTLEGSKYTARLDMIVNTFKWMYKLFEDQSVDLIVNCGDLFDSYKVRAEELSAMAEALSYSSGIKEYHVIGNHEIYDKRRDFYATALLGNYSNVNIVDQPLKLQNGISFLPYMPWEDAQELLPMLSNRILFSHIDIQGSRVTPTYLLDAGVDGLKLSDCFDLVINGHIHAYQKINSKVINIGATTSTSFSDDPAYMPGVAILDTDTLSYQHYSNPYAILFRRFEGSMDELDAYCNNLKNRIALRCDIDYTYKHSAAELLSSNDNIVAFRINALNKSNSVEEKSSCEEIELVGDINNEFVSFLKSCEELKYPLSDYTAIVESLS